MPKKGTRGVCSLDGCDVEHEAKGYCNRHYQKFLRWGDPLGGGPTWAPHGVNPPKLTQEERRRLRFESLFDKDGPVPSHRPDLGACWVWRLKPAKKSGYAVFTNGRAFRVLGHRFSYELYVGPIPEGLVLDHLCRRRNCVNPRHLEPVTDLENWQRGAGWGIWNGMRSTCIHGHEMTPENTYYAPSKPNNAKCRTCSRLYDQRPERRFRRRKKAA